MIWYALDIETATEAWGSICEIAVVEFQDDTPTGKSLQSMVRPPGNLYDPEIQKQYGKHDTVNAPEWGEVSQAIASRVGTRPVVAHNAQFDVGHLSYKRKAEGTWCPSAQQTACSLRLARWVDPDSPNHKLVTLVDRLNLQVVGDSHTAEEDAVAAGMVFAAYAKTHMGSVGEAMQALAANPDVGQWRWLQEHRSVRSPMSEPQSKYIQDLLHQLQQQPGGGTEEDHIYLSLISNGKSSENGWWLNLTKLEASDLISWLRQRLDRPTQEFRSDVGQELARYQSKGQLNVNVEKSSNGLFFLRCENVGPVVLTSPPAEGEEVAGFLAAACTEDLVRLRDNLCGRPET